MNAINVIRPYKDEGVWMFDDKSVGVAREPFVSGADTLLDLATAMIPEAGKGFTLLFSGAPFPGWALRLTREQEELEGTWYRSEEFQRRGWLCAVLRRYFASPPPEIFVQVRS